MKKIFLFALLSATISVSPGQINCNIKRAYAFYSSSLPGAQMVDENGNPVPPKPIINRFIYVESSGTTMPDIKTVLYGNMQLVFSLVKIKDKTVSVGNGYDKNKDVIIAAKKGNTLWKIDLQPMAEKAIPETNCKSIIIKSRIANKFCRFYLQKETEILSLPSY